MGDTNKFRKKDVLNILQNSNKPLSKEDVEIKRWAIIEWIRQNPNQTCYSIARGTKTNYSQMYQIIRELLFCRLISKTRVQSENGEYYTGYFIPEVKDETIN